MFFKKKRSDSGFTIDLGKMRERGIIKDTPAQAAQAPPSETVSSTASSASDDSLGFLGSLAGAATATGSSEFATTQPAFSDKKEFEDKIDRMSERVYKLIERIELLEHKLNRIERKSGYESGY